MAKRQIDDLLAHVDQSGGPDACWEWQGTRRGVRRNRPDGIAFGNYGRVWNGQRLVAAHRAVYERFVGPIPDGLIVRHRCDNPPCCNPAHLVVGTTADNQRDRRERNRDVVSCAPIRPSRGEHRPAAKLSGVRVRKLRREYAAGESIPKLAERYGLSTSTTRSALIGATWAHIPGAITAMRSPVRRPA